MIDDETLMAYADGELSAAERTEIEAALAADPLLRAKLEAHHSLRARLSTAFDSALEEPAPQHLTNLLRPQGKANIVDLAAARAARPLWSAREWTALAASTVLGLVIGVSVMGGDRSLIGAGESGLIARGALAHALETQLAKDQGQVRIGLTFASHEGELCRTFIVAQGGPAGLACKEDGRWRIALAMASEDSAAADYQQAATAIPSAVLALVETRISGDAFDAAQEASARERDWRMD